MAASEPHDSGKVTAKTNIKCIMAVSRSDQLERINLMPLRRLETSRQILMDEQVQPYFQSHVGQCLHKN